MAESVERLLAGIIDYAGLFPPARHPMNTAVREYAELVDGRDSWIVDRFVCPTTRLGELLDFLPETEEVWRITAIGQGLGKLREDLGLIDDFELQAEERATVEAIETPADDLNPGALKKLADVGFEEAYVEVPLGEGQTDALHAIAETDAVFAKARTGGIEARAFPDAESLAAFLHECASLDLPFKLTAGLHHPFRRRDDALGVDMHGFLQIGVALAIAIEHDSPRQQVARIVGETDPAAFEFGEGYCRWRGVEASIVSIDAARELFRSFGSCSVAEPLADLAAAHLLPEGVGA